MPTENYDSLLYDMEPFVEVDPTGRFGRYSDLLGIGAVKRVYRAFDQDEGIDVAWSQVELRSFSDDPVLINRLHSEVQLLKSLKNKYIIVCYSVWKDDECSTLNFITEVCTSGNLRDYRKKHRHVSMKALKKWLKQVLEGLEYLHTHEPCIIHRDLNCSNIFVNGNTGQAKKMQSDHGKLFIGGISWDTNEERLKEYFSTYGEVGEAVIMKDRNTGRARGFGFVVFADPAVAEIVVQEKHSIDGRMVEAKKAVPREDQNILIRGSGSIQGSPGPGRTKKIFVGGLASTVTETDFKKYFDQFGTITDVVVMYDHNTQRPRGFGFITFDSEDAVDKVLLKTFHELNGKMVEVKRAVPKELSPGPSRSPLTGYSFGSGRANSFLGGYTQYSPNAVGDYRIGMDGRFSPVPGGRSGFPPFGSGYGIGMNFEPGMNPNYGGNANFNGTLNYGRGMSPFYIGNSNMFDSGNGYDGGNGGNTSFFSSVTRNLWGNGGLNYGTNSASSSAYMGPGSGNIGGSTFGNSAVNLGSSAILAQRGGNSVSNNSGNLSYDGGDYNGYGLGTGGYGRTRGTNIAPASSYTASNGGYEGAFSEFGYGGSVYGDRTWRPSYAEQQGSGPLGYALGSASSDVSAKSNPGYVGDYNVNKRQPNRGIST